MTNTKLIFWGSEANIETLQKSALYIWLSYKLVLKPDKSPNRIFWATEYWFKTLKCEIWLTNTKPFFWESKGNVETPRTSLYNRVPYKFVFEVWEKPKSNLMSYRILVQGFKMRNLLDECKTIFLGKGGKRWNTPKTFFL